MRSSASFAASSTSLETRSASAADGSSDSRGGSWIGAPRLSVIWIFGRSLSTRLTLVHDLALDDVVTTGRSRVRTAGAAGRGRLLLLSVRLLRELVRRLEQLLGRLLDGFDVASLECLLRGVDL